MSTSPNPSRKPKSSRLQFSACGACRMRRVRCDLKNYYDFAQNCSGIIPTCTNCRERGLNCVDEFAASKSAKVLNRRGRRLEKAKEIYGQSASPDDGTIHSQYSLPIIDVPQLKPDFFQSDFFKHLHLQRPILDSDEFSSRYTKHYAGHDGFLGPDGKLIAVILVIWAISFGLDESGRPLPSDTKSQSILKEKCNKALVQIFHYIDHYGILRRVTWDGVCALLLLFPLTEDIQIPMDRLVFYETTINQIYALCNIVRVPFPHDASNETDKTLLRARIFWYAHIQEGISTAMRGGRLHLTDGDLECFEHMIRLGSWVGRSSKGDVAKMEFDAAARLADLPLKLSSVCRKVHSVLTGPAVRKQKFVDEGSLMQIWVDLDRFWDEFGDFGRSASVKTGNGLNVGSCSEEYDTYVCGWQMFIFECYDIIRQALQHRMISLKNFFPTDEVKSQLEATELLHELSREKCIKYLDKVLDIVRRHLNGPLFLYDSALVADPLFLACVLLAESGGNEADFEMCLRAMKRTDWVFSKVDQRKRALQLIWERRHERTSKIAQEAKMNPCSPASPVSPTSPAASASYSRWEGQANPALAYFDIDACSSTTDSPISPTSEHSNSPATSFQDVGSILDSRHAHHRSIDINQMDMQTKDLLSSEFKQSMVMSKDQDRQLQSMVFSTYSTAFTLQPFADMSEYTDFLLAPQSLDDGDKTPRSLSTPYDSYTNTDYFLQ